MSFLEDDFLSRVGRNVRTERKSRSMRQRDLASLCGWPFGGRRISEIERTGAITLRTLYRIAVALEIEPKELLK